MAKNRGKKFRSRKPPPSWDQVAWLLGGGIVQLILFYLMSLYSIRLNAKGVASDWFETAFGLMTLLSLVGFSAIVLAIYKAIRLLLMAGKEKKSPKIKKAKYKR